MVDCYNSVQNFLRFPDASDLRPAVVLVGSDFLHRTAPICGPSFTIINVLASGTSFFLPGHIYCGRTRSTMPPQHLCFWSYINLKRPAVLELRSQYCAPVHLAVLPVTKQRVGFVCKPSFFKPSMFKRSAPSFGPMILKTGFWLARPS